MRSEPQQNPQTAQSSSHSALDVAATPIQHGISSQISLRLFGGFLLSAGRHRLDVSPRLAGALAYLARRPDVEIPRDRLAGLNWSNVPTEQAKSNLRVALCRVNRILEEAHPGISRKFLRISARSICFVRSQFSIVDANDFEDIMDLHRERKALSDSSLEELRRGIDLYRDDLLPDSDAFWIVEDRENLRKKYLYGLKQVMLGAIWRKDMAEASVWVDRFMKADLGNESTAILAMRIAAYRGNRTQIVRTYRSLTQVLRHEFGIAPAAATEEAFRDLVSRSGDRTAMDFDVARVERTLF
jgi:DNA-binding SARP family transcriptional activator